MKYTRFERARLLGSRILQIAAGAPPLVSTNERDPYSIAKLELEQDVLPIEVGRPTEVKEGKDKK